MILFGGFIQAIVFLIGRFIYIKHTTGKFWNWKNSGFRDPDTDKFRFKSVLAILLDAFIKVIAGYLVILSFKYALYANVNQGAISTIFSLSSVYVSVISWFLFDEKLNRFHITGMAFLISSTILIAFSKKKTEAKKIKVFNQEIDVMSPLVPVSFALITTLLYSFRTIYVKLFVRNLKFHSFDYMTYSYLISGLIFIPDVLYNMTYDKFFSNVFLLGLSSGVLNGMAAFFMFHATSTGVTGPAYALKNIEIAVQASFGNFLLGEILNRNQLFAIVLGILGSLTITIGPYIFKTQKQKDHEEELLEKIRLNKV